MNITCIAVDDEPLALDQMKEFIDRIPFLKLKATFRKGFDAIMYLKENKTDLVFLDIQMEDISGIQILKTLNEKPYIILTTAYNQYALESFELDVFDYLLKPISFERFMKSVDKLYDLLKRLSTYQTITKQDDNNPDFIFVKADYKMQKIILDEILCIEGYKDYLKFHLTQKRNIVSLMSFKKIENCLPAGQFIRIHKSFIIALNKIDNIGKNALQIGEHYIPIGEYYKDAFFEVLERRNLLK